jgi:predicted metal-dependent phosphoesterase TrpH
MRTDLHLHTFVSDGDLDPVQVVAHAAQRGIGRLSITDHDSLGAYLWEGGRLQDEARARGLELIVGVELDAHLAGEEVHLLGYDVSLNDSALSQHLSAVKTARLTRARREIVIVNEKLGAGAIEDSDVFRPWRETYMKPHFIHPLLAKGCFPDYQKANAWFKANVASGVTVPKPAITDAIRLVHAAGGWACLAHPAYYEKSGINIAERLAELKAHGLDGVEVEYPYHRLSPRLFDQQAEDKCVAEIRRMGQSLGLRLTTGTDCHTTEDFDRVYGGDSKASATSAAD